MGSVMDWPACSTSTPVPWGCSLAETHGLGSKAPSPDIVTTQKGRDSWLGRLSPPAQPRGAQHILAVACQNQSTESSETALDFLCKATTDITCKFTQSLKPKVAHVLGLGTRERAMGFSQHCHGKGRLRIQRLTGPTPPKGANLRVDLCSSTPPQYVHVSRGVHTAPN